MRSRIRNFRPAFTLVELLIVLSILSILVALTAVAVLRFGGAGSQRATSARVAALTKKMQTQWLAVADKARRENMPANMTSAAGVNALMAWGNLQPLSPGYSGLTVNDPRIRGIYVQARLSQAFPQSIREALNLNTGRTPPPSSGPDPSLNPLGAWPGYVDYLNKYSVTGGGSASGATDLGGNPVDVTSSTRGTLEGRESSVCLLMILTVGPQNLGVDAESFGAGGVASLQVGNNNAQVPGFVDGWGRPVVFARDFFTASLIGYSPQPYVASAGYDGYFGVAANIFITDTPTMNIPTAPGVNGASYPGAVGPPGVDNITTGNAH
jgi:prepilin-type N-terminal cleavage/methylation domain-containing protein